MDEDLELIRRSGGEHHLKRAAWERVVCNWRESGLRPGEFCRRHGLSSKRLYQWRKRLAGPAALSEAAVEPRLIAIDCAPPRPTGVLEIELASATLRLPYERSASQLSMILRSLKEAAC
jgi:hypothetical protein